jgi:hypothetical protein
MNGFLGATCSYVVETGAAGDAAVAANRASRRPAEIFYDSSSRVLMQAAAAGRAGQMVRADELEPPEYVPSHGAGSWLFKEKRKFSSATTTQFRHNGIITLFMSRKVEIEIHAAMLGEDDPIACYARAGAILPTVHN